VWTSLGEKCPAFVTSIALRKTYHALMQFVGSQRFNAYEQRAKEVRLDNPEVTNVRISFKRSRSSAFPHAVQRRLRFCVKLTRAGIDSTTSAQMGTSRTQAPSRPRRLHKIQADLVLFAIGHEEEEKRK
jgi:hypothetical protein